MANRFDELLPIQPILQQSLYTPFRMKDNTDLYTKLISTLATKKDKTIKPDAVPVAERHKPILPIQYKTNSIVLPNADISQGANMTFNIDYSTPYNYIEGLHWNNINAEGNQLINALANGNIDDDDAMGLVLGYKRDVAGYKNNPTLERYRIMNENIYNMTKGLQNNPELDMPTYRKLAQMEFLSKNLLDAPLESKVESKDMTFNEALTKYYKAIETYGMSNESAIRPIWQAVSDKSLVQIFETITTTNKGSFYNPQVENLRELNNLRESANNLLELQLMTNLKNRGVTREYQNGQFAYNNLYDLHLLIEDNKIFNNTSFETLKQLRGEEFVNSMLKDRELILTKNAEIQKSIKDDLNNFKIDNEVFEGTYGQLQEKYNELRKNYPELIAEYNTLKKSNNPNKEKIQEIEGKFETLEKYSKQLIRSEYEFTKKKFEDIQEMKSSLDKDLYYYNLVKKESMMESIKNIEKNLNISKGAFTSKEDATTRNNQTVGLSLQNQNSNNNNNKIKDSEKGLFYTYNPMSVYGSSGKGTFTNVLSVTGSFSKLQDGSNPVQAIFGTSTGYNEFLGENSNLDNITLYYDVKVDGTQPKLIITAENHKNGNKTITKEIPYNINEKNKVVYATDNIGEFEALNTIMDEANPQTKDLVTQFKGKMEGIAMLAKNSNFEKKSSGIQAATAEEKIAKTIFDEKNFGGYDKKSGKYFNGFNDDLNIITTLRNANLKEFVIDSTNREKMMGQNINTDLKNYLSEQMTGTYTVEHEIKDKNGNTIMKISAQIPKTDIHKVVMPSIDIGIYDEEYNDKLFMREGIYNSIDKYKSTINLNYEKAYDLFNKPKQTYGPSKEETKNFSIFNNK